MSTTTLRFVALMLAALAMGMHLAHALELAPKLQWDASLYFAVQSSLYSWFGRIGPLLEVGALLAVSALAWRSRGQRGFAPVATSATLLAVSLAMWALLVLPAHRALSGWQAGAPFPADWMAWRAQWQYAQAGIFALHLVGFAALLRSLPPEPARLR